MKRLIFILILLSKVCFGQEVADTLKILAQQLTTGEGSKIHIAKYKVLKVLEGTLNVETIFVGYADYKGINHSSEPVLLTLLKYEGRTSIKNYYHYPNYNALEGAEKINLLKIDRAYWEGCETGEGACEPLTFYRDSKIKKIFLLMPCGGTVTDVSLSNEHGVALKNTWMANNCPPMFDLTTLGDGKYSAYMLACGLGGGITFMLKTK
jgi:hypothetical protein